MPLAEGFTYIACSYRSGPEEPRQLSKLMRTQPCPKPGVSLRTLRAVETDGGWGSQAPLVFDWHLYYYSPAPCIALNSMTAIFVAPRRLQCRKQVSW